MSTNENPLNKVYFEIIRDWFQYQLDYQKTKPIHSALFLYLVEKFNSLWWPDEIGVPTDFTMTATCIGSYNTYKKTLNELEGFGFVKIGERGRNQYVSTKVALSFFDKAYTKARDKAKYKALIKQVTKQLSDNKQENNETQKQLNILKEDNQKLKIEIENLKKKKDLVPEPKVNTPLTKKEKENLFKEKVNIIHEKNDIITKSFFEQGNNLDGFIDYWTESNDNSMTLKYEKQQTFDIARRLQTWKRNNFNGGSNSQKPKKIEQSKEFSGWS